MFKTAWIPALALAAGLAVVPLAGCDREGPGEETGEKVDEALDKLAHPNEGPLEKTGRKIDEAAEDAAD